MLLDIITAVISLFHTQSDYISDNRLSLESQSVVITVGTGGNTGTRTYVKGRGIVEIGRGCVLWKEEITK
jgi:hypothetical protein